MKGGAPFYAWGQFEMKKYVYNFIVIGAGGTGSYLLTSLTRFFCGSLSVKGKLGRLLIIDGDNVEMKNLSRQGFGISSVNSNKATDMASYLNTCDGGIEDSVEHRGYDGPKWESYPYYVTSAETVKKLCFTDRYAEASRRVYVDGEAVTEITVPVIVGCVDNHAARLVMEDVFHQLDNVVYIDTANDYIGGQDGGQVVFAAKLDGKSLGNTNPLRSDRFSGLKGVQHTAVTEMSCEELNKVKPQHIAANMYSALNAFVGICGLFEQSSGLCFVPGVCMFEPFKMYSEFFKDSESEFLSNKGDLKNEEKNLP